MRLAMKKVKTSRTMVMVNAVHAQYCHICLSANMRSAPTGKLLAT